MEVVSMGKEHYHHEHHYGHRHGPGMGMMGRMGPMRMMGPWAGMMRGMHGMGVCPWCGMVFGGKGRRYKGPYSITKTAKKELLIEKVKERLEQKYGDELNKLADEMISFAEERQRTKADLMEKKIEMRHRMWEFLTGGEPEEEEGEEGE